MSKHVFDLDKVVTLEKNNTNSRELLKAAAGRISSMDDFIDPNAPETSAYIKREERSQEERDLAIANCGYKQVRINPQNGRLFYYPMYCNLPQHGCKKCQRRLGAKYRRRLARAMGHEGTDVRMLTLDPKTADQYRRKFELKRDQYMRLPQEDGKDILIIDIAKLDDPSFVLTNADKVDLDAAMDWNWAGLVTNEGSKRKKSGTLGIKSPAKKKENIYKGAVKLPIVKHNPAAERAGRLALAALGVETPDPDDLGKSVIKLVNHRLNVFTETFLNAGGEVLFYRMQTIDVDLDHLNWEDSQCDTDIKEEDCEAGTLWIEDYY